MQIELQPAARSDALILHNLLQYYLYDFSEIEQDDVNERGRFAPYPYLRYYWKEAGCHPFLIRADGKLAGFVLAHQKGERDGLPLIWMAEFFVLRRFRRLGVGKSAAFQAFDRLRGIWQVAQVPNNIAAQAFWRRIIAEYTGGNFQETLLDDPLFWEGPLQEFKNC